MIQSSSAGKPIIIGRINHQSSQRLSESACRPLIFVSSVAVAAARGFAAASAYSELRGERRGRVASRRQVHQLARATHVRHVSGVPWRGACAAYCARRSLAWWAGVAGFRHGDGRGPAFGTAAHTRMVRAHAIRGAASRRPFILTAPTRFERCAGGRRRTQAPTPRRSAPHRSCARGSVRAAATAAPRSPRQTCPSRHSALRAAPRHGSKTAPHVRAPQRGGKQVACACARMAVAGESWVPLARPEWGG